MSFVHLHCHTEGSLLDGMCRSKDMAKQAAKFGMPAIAITDHGVMYNVVQFYENCTSAGVKPIIGCEVYVAPEHRTKKGGGKGENYNHMLLLAQNETGYKNLVKLVSRGYLEGFYYKPRVDKELLQEYSEGLIATSACLGGEICGAIMKNELQQARYRASALKEIYGKENFYIELQNHGLDEQKYVNPELVRIARELDLPLICSNDVHYLRQQDADPHEVLLCIQTGVTMNNPKRLRYGPPNFYLRSPEEMAGIFGEWPDSLENTLHIADRCNFQFDFSKIHLPHCEVPEGYTFESYLEKLCRDFIPQKYSVHTQELEDRLTYELDVIQTKGYSAYFLIVYDFVRFARSRGIMSQARGSAAGSLISYLLGLTVIDPLKYNLLFERFLNRERKSMPDIDLDFADDRREEVIQYCRDKYGADHVAQIIAFGTMAAKAAVRDAGRALEYPLQEVDRVAKLIPTIPGTKLAPSLETIPELKKLYEEDERAKKLVDTAQSVEGLYRHCSVHAAGVVITKEPVIEYAPVQRMGEDNLAIQYEWGDAEKIGLLKMDFLGLRNLTVVDKCLKLIRKHRGVNIVLKDVPYTDEKTYKLLMAGDSIGVFQFESSGMQKLLRNLKPDRLEDLIALVALYRPGPLQSGMADEFVKRKHGVSEIVYLHPLLEPILNNSYGIILYQEQVMKITMALADFTAGQAEGAMKAMSKKKHDVMEKLKPAFLNGAVAKGVEQKIAEQIYDVMYNFASYGFNLNHSAAYAVLSYHTAYLKANFKHEFMATNLSSIVDKKDKLALYIDDVRRMGIELLPPSVNLSEAEFTVEANEAARSKKQEEVVYTDGDGIEVLPGPKPPAPTSIRMGLEAIKNVSRPCIDVVLKARAEGGPFTDFADFIRRVCGSAEAQVVSKTAIECLIKAGALDGLPGHRAQFLAALETAMSAAATYRKEQSLGQTSLFGGDDEDDASLGPINITLPAVPEMSKQESLALERDLLGVYVSDHPLKEAKNALKSGTNTNSAELPEKKDREEVTIGGIISALTIRMTKTNLPMANVTLEDMTGPMTVVFFPKSYEKVKDQLEKDRIVIIRGRASVRDRIVEDEDAPAIVEVQGEEVTPIQTRQVVHIPSVHVRLRNARRTELLVMRQLFAANPGTARLLFHIEQNGKEDQVLSGLRVDVNPTLLQEVGAVAGRVGGSVWVE